MKKLLFFFFIVPSVLYARPQYPEPNTPNKVWQNDLDLDKDISTLESTVFVSTYITNYSTRFQRFGVGIATGTRGSNFNFAGKHYINTTTVNSSTASYTPSSSVKVFTIQTSNGDGALCYTNYLSGTITVLGSSGNISNTTTPGAAVLGVNKTANSHLLNFVTGSAASGTFASWSVCFIGTSP